MGSDNVAKRMLHLLFFRFIVCCNNIKLDEVISIADPLEHTTGLKLG